MGLCVAPMALAQSDGSAESSPMESGASSDGPAVAKTRRASGKRPRVMREPGDVTDVIDAFDNEEGDPFDLSVGLGFNYFSKRARILRESSVYAPGLTTGGYTTRRQNVGQYIETTSRLVPRLDVGLFRDLALFFEAPIVLKNSRKIEDIDGSAGNSATTAGAPGENLFAVPFTAPDRSGLEYLALGLNFAIFNQARDYTKPTWVFGVETQLSVGTPMHACNANPAPGEVECAQPGDINRNGQRDSDGVDANGDPLESANAGDERNAGVTRGTVALAVHSVMSKRLKYIEPYGGFRARFEFQMGDESDYGRTDFQGALVNHPPIVGTVMLGMMIHPWENREKFSRLSFDLRFQGEYHSEGRDYSELFDALGSSSAGSLRSPKWSRYSDACPGGACTPKSVVDPSSDRSYFTGLTVVEPYGSYRAAGAVTWRASEYVKLTAGLGLRFEQAHGITHDQPCNPDFTGDVGQSGPCHSDLGNNTISANGIPNPAYRPTINAIGRRFYVDQSTTYEVFARGTVMF